MAKKILPSDRLQPLAKEETQLFHIITDLETAFEIIASNVSKNYIDQETVRAEARIQHERELCEARGQKPNEAVLKKYRQSVKEKVGAVAHEIYKSVSLVKKSYQGPSKNDQYKLEPLLDRDTIFQNDPDLRLIYMTVELPQNFSRDAFSDEVNKYFHTHVTKDKIDLKSGQKTAGDFYKESDRLVENVPMRKFIIPLEKLFPDRNKGLGQGI